MQATSRLFVLLLSSIVLLALPTIALAADKSGEQVVVNAKNLKWVDAPPSLPKGAKVVTLYGDPTSNGHYVIRLSMPSKYKIPFHWHSQPQRMTVVSGTFYVASTETYDKKIAHGVKQGGFVILPARAQQFAFTKGKTIVEIHGEGPFDVKYTNPSDDPEMGVKGKPYYFPKEYEENELNMKEGGEPIPTF